MLSYIAMKISRHSCKCVRKDQVCVTTNTAIGQAPESHKVLKIYIHFLES